MKIDHVSVGGSDLRRMEEAFSAAGMKTEYGGLHSGGITHMSLLGFEDGSYFELISTARPGMKPSIWRKQIEGNGGPCAWAIQVENIAQEVTRAKEMDIPATGPSNYNRKRPDGVLIEWQLGFLGGGEPGAVLPFLITDITPREYRVSPSPSVSGPGSLLSGVSKVILGVDNIEETIERFRKLYGWSEPEASIQLLPGTRLASFSGTPVVVAAPEGESWLSGRLRRFGPSPCAFLVEARNMHEAGKRYDLEPSQPWFEGKNYAWLKKLRDDGTLIGLVGL